MSVLVLIENALRAYERDPYTKSNLLKVAETLKNIEGEYEDLVQDDKTKLDYLLKNYQLPSYEDFKNNRENSIDTYLTLLEEKIEIITKEQYEENKNLISDIINKMISISTEDISYEDLFSLSKDSDRKEFIKLVETYFEILKETNQNDLLKEIVLKISNKDIGIRKEGWETITNNINQLSTKKYFSKKGKKLILNTGKSGEADGEFYYLKDNTLNSKSLSVTKAGESRFEGIQNNTHNLKTKLKNSILRKLIEINGNKEQQEEYLKTIMSQIRERKIKEDTHNLVHVLNKMATINQSELLLMELKYSEEEIIDYLSMKTSYYKKITKKGLSELSFSNVTIEDMKNYKEKGLDNYLEDNKDKENMKKDYKKNQTNNFSIPNENEHRHIFSIFNNGVFYTEDKNNEKLNTIITLFSHINNDMLNLKRTNIDKEVVINYIEKTINVFKHLEIELVKSTKKEGIKKQREDTSKIFTKNKTQNNSTINQIGNIIEVIKEYEENGNSKNIIKSDMKFNNVKEAIGVLSFYLEHLKTLKENDKNNTLENVKNTIDNSTSFQSETFLTVGYGEAKKTIKKIEEEAEETKRAAEEIKRAAEEKEKIMNALKGNDNGLTSKQLGYILTKEDNSGFETTTIEYLNEEKIIEIIIMLNNKFSKEKVEKLIPIHYKMYLNKMEEEEELFWKIIKPKEKSIELKEEREQSLNSLSEWIILKYLDGNLSNKEIILGQIENMKEKGISNIALETEIELEKTIQKILKEESIDISKMETKELSKEITKGVMNKFGM